MPDDFAAEGVHALCKFGTDIAHADYECATVPDTADGAFIVPGMSLLVAIVAVEFLLQHQYHTDHMLGDCKPIGAGCICQHRLRTKNARITVAVCSGAV